MTTSEDVIEAIMLDRVGIVGIAADELTISVSIWVASTVSESDDIDTATDADEGYAGDVATGSKTGVDTDVGEVTWDCT